MVFLPSRQMKGWSFLLLMDIIDCVQHSQIEIYHAYTHNLKGVSCNLPIHRWTVLTGVSGSGKSSLIFDTLVQEGATQYRHLFPPNTRSTKKRNRYGRRCLAIRGLPPILSLTQSFTPTTPRSTLSSLIHLQEGLSLLYAQFATPYCPIAHKPLEQHTEESILAFLRLEPAGHRLLFLRRLAPCTSSSSLRALLIKDGYATLRVNNEWINLYDTPCPEWVESDIVELLLDRIEVSPYMGMRTSKAIQQALQHEGTCHVVNETSGTSYLWKTGHYSPTTGLTYPPLKPLDFHLIFSPNLSPHSYGPGIQAYPAAARWRDTTLPQLLSLPIPQLMALLYTSPLQEEEEILDGIRSRLTPLVDLGLTYLSLDRRISTLSQGEAQRARLAAEIGGSLTGLVYVLDEPMQGLHVRDQAQMLPILRKLRDRGNTLLIVDHHPSMIREADEVIDFGPGAGQLGGEILYQGPLEGLLHHPTSLTGAYLSGRSQLFTTTSQPLSEAWLEFHNLPYRNLKPNTFRIPIHRLTAVTGVSGSGKSTLLFEVLLPAMQHALGQQQTSQNRCSLLVGAEAFQSCITLEPTPTYIPRRSVIATYLGIFDDIRHLFASLPESQQRGWSASMFSFNRSPLRCPSCSGMGSIPLEDADQLWTICPECDGERFTDPILEARYKGRSIADLLDSTVTEAYALLSHLPAIKKVFPLLIDIGLGYVTLGQPIFSLSGGEYQRLYIAKQLGKPSNGPTLYLLDEPSRGLHPHDLHGVWKLFSALLHQGHTIVVVEHHLELIRACDWVIEMGPTGGDGGGYLLAAGTPNELSTSPTPTGQALSLVHSSGIDPTPPPLLPTWNTIQIRDAEAKNLQHISLDIPKQKLTVVCGPMGSGKSALLIDTLHAAALRYYGMQLFPTLCTVPSPEVHSIQGLTPTAVLGSWHDPIESSLGEATRLTEILHVLFHLRGESKNETESKSLSPNELCTIMTQKQGSYVILLAPLPQESSRTVELSLQRWSREGWVRIRYGTSYYDIDDPIPWDLHQNDSLALVIDEMRIGTASTKRLEESIIKAFQTGGGHLLISIDGYDQPYSLRTLESGYGIHHHKTERFLGSLPYSDAMHLPLCQLLSYLEHEIPQDIHVFFTLNVLIALGLGQYTLHTPLAQLNHEEQIRCSWASILSTPLRGLTYLLDERSLGLVAGEQERFVHILKHLLTQGHTILLAANDPFWLHHADYVISLGYGAGKTGGHLLYAGSSYNPKPNPPIRTITKQHRHPTHALHGNGWTVPIGGGLSIFSSSDPLSLSWWSLLHEALAPHFPRRSMLSLLPTFSSGLRVADVTGLAPLLRSFYSLLPAAAAEGLSPIHFDPKNPLGQCTTCLGLGGYHEVSSDVVPCPYCEGSGLHAAALAVRYRNAHLGQVLQQSITEISNVFSFLPKVHSFCLLLERWGLGDLPLNRSISSLSSIEQQTLRLFRILKSSNSMILMDRPTMGMESGDVMRWIPLFEEAIERGVSFLLYDVHPIWKELGYTIHMVPNQRPSTLRCTSISS